MSILSAFKTYIVSNKENFKEMVSLNIKENYDTNTAVGVTEKKVIKLTTISKKIESVYSDMGHRIKNEIKTQIDKIFTTKILENLSKNVNQYSINLRKEISNFKYFLYSIFNYHPKIWIGDFYFIDHLTSMINVIKSYGYDTPFLIIHQKAYREFEKYFYKNRLSTFKIYQHEIDEYKNKIFCSADNIDNVILVKSNFQYQNKTIEDIIEKYKTIHQGQQKIAVEVTDSYPNSIFQLDFSFEKYNLWKHIKRKLKTLFKNKI